MLNLLLDGTTGAAAFRNQAHCSEADMARTIALLADWDASLLIEFGSPAASTGADSALSFSPALESTLERFIPERRQLRAALPVPLLEAAE